jgi:hypothetical protein
VRNALVWRILAVISVGAATPGAARAGDGVIEIHQVKALAGAIDGDASSDPAGFPVRITRPGSYRLTSDLEVDSLATDAILIDLGSTRGEVSIDLAGFEIRGPNVCSGGGPVPVTCSGGDAGRGVAAVTVPSGDVIEPPVTLRDGTIRGTGGNGIELVGDYAQVVGVTVRETGATGILVGRAALVVDSIADLNSAEGFAVQTGSVMRGNSALRNGSIGIVLGSDSVAVRNIASDNRGAGIYSGDSSLLRDNSANGNADGGIIAGARQSLVGNVASQNLGATGHGILAGAGSLAAHNTSVGNALHGISLTSGLATGNTTQENQRCGIDLANGGVAGNTATGNNASDTACGPQSSTNQIDGARVVALDCNAIQCPNNALTILCPQAAGFSCP